MISATLGTVRAADPRTSKSVGAAARSVVPDVVMDELLVPLDLAGVDVDGEQAVAVEVVAVVRAAVVVVADLLDRHEEQAALDVDGEVAPEPGAAGGLQTVAEPGLGVGIVGLRFEVERPAQLAGDGVPRLDRGVAALRDDECSCRRRAATTCGGR